tara:strand:- start:30 stop:452 length:423 start_codon:yes stop_codon:yes gene_type:complete
MVIAFIVPVALGEWALKKVTGEGVVETIATGTKEYLTEVAQEEGLELYDRFVEWFGDIDWSAIGTGIGNAIAAVLEASGGIIGGIGKQVVPNLIEGVENGYDAISEKLSGHESGVISAFVVGFLVVFTFVYLFYEIRRGK